MISQDAEPTARNKIVPRVSRVISQDTEPNAETNPVPSPVQQIVFPSTWVLVRAPDTGNKSYFLVLGYYFEPQTPATNPTSYHLGTSSSPKHRQLIVLSSRLRHQQQIVPLGTWVLARTSVSCVISHNKSNQMPVTNRTLCLVFDITRRRTQCLFLIVPPVSCVLSQDAEPNARNKSYPLSRV